MKAEEIKRGILAAGEERNLHAELKRNAEARERAREEASRDLTTPLFSAQDLAVVAKAASKVQAHRTREQAQSQADAEMRMERALASLEMGDPSATYAAADAMLEASGGTIGEDLRRFIAEDWGPERPQEASRWLAEAEARMQRQRQELAQQHRRDVTAAQQREIKSAMDAANAAYAELENDPDFERVSPHMANLVAGQPQRFLDALAKAPEETLRATFEGARELDRAERLAEFKTAFRSEPVGLSHDFEGMEEVEPEPNLDNVHRALASTEGNVERFKEQFVADPLAEGFDAWAGERERGPS